jgi:hypothetical protein
MELKLEAEEGIETIFCAYQWMLLQVFISLVKQMSSFVKRHVVILMKCLTSA